MLRRPGKVKRKIIEIDEKKCNGCGKCIPNCPEGAIQIIDDKARLVSDLFCDGLGACIGHCPEGAITIIERDAEPYSEKKVMERIVRQGKNVIKAHLEHLKEHGEKGYLNEAVEFLKEKGIENPMVPGELPCGCPGSKVMDLKNEKKHPESHARMGSELSQWPVQLMLVPPSAPYFDNADILITADCVPFAYANFHQDFLRGRRLVMGCPKLDDIEFYTKKLTQILELNNIRSIKLVHMEVPCCFGLKHAVEKAVKESGKNVDISESIVSISGEVDNK